MPAPRRLLPLALAALALGGLGVWLSVSVVAKKRSAAPVARSIATQLGTTTTPHATLPAPGSAIEFNSLLALARTDLAAFTDWLEKHAAALPPQQRLLFLRELMRRWLAEWQSGDPGIEEAFRRLAATSPETAGRLVALLPSVPLRHIMVEELIAAWGAADPDAAERWLATLDNGNDRSHGFTALAEARLRRDPAAAMQWANERLATTTNPAMVQDFALGFAAADPARTAEWAAAMPEGELKNQATVILAATWADTDTTKASQWATALPPSGARDDAVTAIGQIWSGTEPAEAIRWFETQNFTSPDARSEGYRHFSEALTAGDPEAGQRWIDSLTDPTLADAALAGAADITYADNPEQAVLTAMKIQDIVSRATLVGELMNDWREDDPDAAEKFAAVHMAPQKKP